MAITKQKPMAKPGALILRDVPGELLRKIRVNAASEGKAVKPYVIEILDRHVKEVQV